MRFPLFSSWFESRGRVISLVAGGNALGQIITLAAAPVLARLYSPAAFGEFAVVISIVTLASVASTLSLQQAVNVPEDRVRAAAVARLALHTAGWSTLLGGLACAGWIMIAGGASYWWVTPPLLIGNASASVFAVWANREGHFSTLVRARVAGALAGTIGMLACARAGTAGLLWGQTLGAIASAVWLGVGFRRTAPRASTPVAAMQLWREHRIYPLWRLPADLLNATVSQVPLWIFGHVFGATTAGHFSLVHRVYNAPVMLVGTAIGDVFTRQAGAAYRERRACAAQFDHFARDLALLGLLVCVPVAVLGPALFAFVFGAQWRGAGELARWLSAWYFLRFAISPLSSLLIIAARPGLDLILQLVLLAGVAGAWLVASGTGSLPATIGALTATAVAFYGGNFVLTRRLSRGGLVAAKPAPAA